MVNYLSKNLKYYPYKFTYILYCIVSTQENLYQHWIFPSCLKENSQTMIHFFLKSNITTSLEQRSYLMLISPDFLDTGNRFQEVSARFNAPPVISTHAIVFPAFPNLWMKNFHHSTVPRLLTLLFLNQCLTWWWELSSNDKVPLGFVLGFRELQNLQLQRHWNSKMLCKGIRAGCHKCPMHTFQSAQPTAMRTSAQCHAVIRVSVSFRVEWGKEPTALGTLGLEQEWQDHPSRASALLLLLLPKLDHPYGWGI